MSDNINKVFVVSGPSGSGKSTLVAALMAQCDLVSETVSHTTRLPRSGEVCGQHYHFMEKAEFLSGVDAGCFVEYAEVFGNLYGTSKGAIQAVIDAGKSPVLILDIQGAESLRQSGMPVVTIFIAPPTIDELRQRLEARGEDSAAVIVHRLADAPAEMLASSRFEHVVVNDCFDVALEQLRAIVSV